MCTSSLYRKKDTIIAMNFDNNGMKYSVSIKDPKQFLVLVDGGHGTPPAFGVNSKGIFVNNIVVNANGKGLYKPPSKKVTNTSKLVAQVLNGTIATAELDEYLHRMEVVHIPVWSTHNMICDEEGNVWVVEPGRGIISSRAEESQYFVMTNFSLWDYKNESVKCDCGRYRTVSNALLKEEDLDVAKAFRILESAKQSEGEWITAFSMVYSKNKNAVYYCYNGDFSKWQEHHFED